jgi:hypothetical protein
MEKQIDDLVARRDANALFELMIAGDDEILQLDAAEGLLRLGDKRGLKFLENALASEDKQVREFADEILSSPDIERQREQIEAEADRAHERRVAEAKTRLQKGKKVFRYKMIFVSALDILQEDLTGEGVNLLDLDDAGLEGWEVVNVVARRQLVMDINDDVSGAYALLRKEISPDQGAELDEV